MAVGDHLRVARSGYTHHGIQVTRDRVVHYSGLANGLQSGPIEEVSLEAFAGGAKIHVVRYPSAERCAPRTVVRRARSRIGEDAYSLTGMNCEHFARWCVTQRHRSKQVERATAAVSVAEVGAAGAGASMIVGSAGSVAGLSGPGIMTGLVAVGPGGAVGGAATLAGGSGLGAALILNNTILKDHPQLEKKERRARKAGRTASLAGAGGATVGGIATISSAGSVAGLSGAGITSGLCSIGTAVGVGGGGAAAGVAVVAAAPVLAAAALGLGVWAIFR